MTVCDVMEVRRSVKCDVVARSFDVVVVAFTYHSAVQVERSVNCAFVSVSGQ